MVRVHRSSVATAVSPRSLTVTRLPWASQVESERVVRVPADSVVRPLWLAVRIRYADWVRPSSPAPPVTVTFA